jgi:hypothetical protein
MDRVGIISFSLTLVVLTGLNIMSKIKDDLINQQAFANKELESCEPICYWCGNTGMTPYIVEDEEYWGKCEEHDYRGRELSIQADEAIKRYGKNK